MKNLGGVYPVTAIFTGESPSAMYMEALTSLTDLGELVSPRGKDIKELRPVIFEFKNPLKRVTFLRGRLINPFFQLSETLWILAGRSDVKWLTRYNASIAQFSDDGVNFNAPYGERLRKWGTNTSEGVILKNSLDQLLDVYKKIKEDPDTRQAVAVIYNGAFDHADKKTLDRPCNLLLTFKLRDGYLDMTVMNRSNDLHWGTFGANLCQFSTIIEVMASWLGVKVGTYYHITDSLHIYLNDYGYKETENIYNAYGIQANDNVLPHVEEFYFEDEPRVSFNYKDFQNFLDSYFYVLDPHLNDDGTFDKYHRWNRVYSSIEKYISDEYFKMTLLAMCAYRAHKSGNVQPMIHFLGKMKDCSWKVSCLRFLYNKYSEVKEFTNLYSHYSNELCDYISRKNK